MRKKNFIIFTSVLVLVIMVLALGYKYRTEYAKKEIQTYYSDDRSYELVIYSIGEPEWPFGPGKCRFVLTGKGKRISECNIIMLNDGKWPHSDNFSVTWMSDRVQIVVNGEEQEDTNYILYFDGTRTF